MTVTKDIIRNLLFVLFGVTAYHFNSIRQRVVTLGLTRSATLVSNVHGQDLRVILNTKHCEDLHFSTSNGLLYTACEGEDSDRVGWFPPMVVFDRIPDKNDARSGSIYTIDPKSFTAKRLDIDLEGPFVTHGIDIYEDPTTPGQIYIHAVNHLPNYDRASSADEEAASRIEIFVHDGKSSHVKHIRSVSHPLIRTPNDIYAIGPDEFWVTNDHKHKKGWKRGFEDIWTGGMACITETVHVKANIEGKKPSSTEQVSATIALDKMHNNNGLGHGSTPDEIMVVDAAGGVLHLASSTAGSPNLSLRESIQLDTTIDNPTYYRDPYPTTQGDSSGYILAGLHRGADYAKEFRNDSAALSSVVWHVSPRAPSQAGGKTRWEKKIIFRDDGKVLSTASTAVLLPIDPAENGGKKEGWLWVTGPSSHAVITFKISLDALV